MTRRPWHERVYAITVSNTRARAAADRGYGANMQHHVTLPSELASLYPDGQGFRWVKDERGLLLVPVDERPASPRRWTAEEIALLRSTLSAAEIHARTGRSATAISCKRSELGIDVHALRREAAS